MMKKFIVLLLMAVATGGSAWAQKGMQGVGVNAAGGLHHSEFSIGAGVKYQYNISDYFRLEPSFSYTWPIDNKGLRMAAFANLHTFFSAPRKVRPYLITGFGFVTGTEEDDYDYDDYCDRESIAPNVGLGLDVRISHGLSLQVEGNFDFILNDDWFEQTMLRFNIGLVYNF